MKSKAQWAPGAGMRVLDAERLDGRWLITAIGGGSGACPRCSAPSTTRHGHYGQQLQDLPEQGSVVTLSVQVTRWQCRNSRCKQRTSSQLMPAVAAPYARRTSRVAELVHLLGHAAGGRPAERLMTRLGMPASDDAILRHLKRQAGCASTQPLLRVAGIDDWSWIKGSRYGTLIVDLERREVVDVLPDRSAESTSRWLSQHPEVEIISRDRCGLYAQGARQGAPQARQVADRFHLLQNLRERIEQQLSRGHATGASSPKIADSHPVPVAPSTACSPRGEPELAVHHHLVKQARRDMRQAMFDRVRALRDAGHSLIAIVRETGFNWRTVAKWARLAVFPPRRIMTPKPSSLAYCKAHLARPAATDPATGHLISPIIAAVLCVRYQPQVTGDGVSSVADLAQRDPRLAGKPVLPTLSAHIPKPGETVLLATVASLRVGGRYEDGSHLYNAELEARIDAIARSMGGFYFGRFDIRYTGAPALQAGDFQIIEVSGAGSEAIQFWDLGLSLFKAYSGVFRKQADLFELAAAFRKRGQRAVGVVALSRAWLAQHA